jgi:endonuclease YncB( thermonuclease family)
MPKTFNDPERSRRTKNSILKKVALTAGAIAIIAGSLTVAKRVIDPTETVTEVIDGDTFTITNKQTIRLFGVDAPELQYCFGKEAKEALSNKILGKKVILKEPKTDFYKRVQAYVYIDGEFVNEYVAKNGFGIYSGVNTESSKIVKDANNFARANKIGIFSEKCLPTVPVKNGCNIKGQIIYDTGKQIYRLPGCPDYTQTKVEKFRGENWFCTEAQAQIAGFTRATNCP